LTLGGLCLAYGDPAPPSAPGGAMDHALNIKPENMKWGPIFPELKDKSPQIVILHTDAKSGATQLMIRVPANFHVPMHWHTANETHTVLSGTLIMECEGSREALGAGSFNYIPGKMHHQAWTTPDEGVLVFITVDGPWDLNWVNGPPKPGDLAGGMKP